MAEQHVSQTTTVRREPGLEQRILTFKATYVIWLMAGLLEVLLAFRIGLKLIAANPANPFAMFIYGFTNVFVLPFMGLVPAPAAYGAVRELSSLIAMVVYALLFWAVERLVWVILYRPRQAAVDVTQSTSNERHTP
jgi:hypothetical protein